MLPSPLCLRFALLLMVAAVFAIPTQAGFQQPPTTTQAGAGTIAYVVANNQTGDEIHLIEPDGSGQRRIWSIGKADPYDVEAITSVEWRPDAGAIAFASDHEAACSWYESDIYAIRHDGLSYWRITNAPACAALTNYPGGTVTVTVLNYNLSPQLYLLYIAGSPKLESMIIAPGSTGTVTFSGVADFGDGVLQPVVAINGLYRWVGAAWADVQQGQTVEASSLVISGEGFRSFGAYKPRWHSDGARIGYIAGSCGPMSGMMASPQAGTLGQPLVSADDAMACAMDWGPTAATANQILYATLSSYDNDRGIFRTTEGSSDMGELLVPLNRYDAESVKDLQWLPDGSGFLFVKTYVDLEILTNIFRYDFATGESTRLTAFADEEYVGELSISPDGQFVVFERAPSSAGQTSLWVMREDGSDMRLLVQHGAHPSWSQQSPPPAPTPRGYLPLIRR